MLFEAITQVTSKGNVSLPVPITEQLGMKDGDTFEVYADENNDKIFLQYSNFDKEVLTRFTPVILNSEASIQLPAGLMDALTLPENEVLKVNLDVQKACIVLEPIPPNCVFCGELGDISLSGKYICPDCAEKIALGEK